MWRLTFWHCCARVFFNPLCCSAALASCCSGHVSSLYFTSMRCTSQREGCAACMSLWWPFLVPTGSMQIAPGLEQNRSSSAERFGRSHWGKVLLATCAGKTRLSWAIRASLPIPVKTMFPPKSPLFKVLLMSLEAMLCLSVTMFWIEACWQPESIWIWLSGWWHNRQDELWLCRKDGPFSECKEYPFKISWHSFSVTNQSLYCSKKNC